MIAWEVGGSPLPIVGYDSFSSESSSSSTASSNSTMTTSAMYESYGSTAETARADGTTQSSTSSISHTRSGRTIASSASPGITTARTDQLGESHTANASGGTTVVPYSGGTTVGSVTFSSTFSSGHTFRQTTSNATTSGTTSFTSSTSISSTSSTTFSSTETYDPYAGAGQTTTEVTTGRTFTTFSAVSSQGTVNTTSSDAIFGQHLTTTTSARTVHSTFTSSTTLNTTVTTTNDTPVPFNHAANTIYIASPCHVLYTGGALAGTANFCDHFSSIAGAVEYSPIYATSSESFAFPGGAQTDYWYDATIITDADYPADHGAGFIEVRRRKAESGYQPWSALGLDDPIYSSYSIQLAASFTETSGQEYSRRTRGSTFERSAAGITQVVTANAEDTLLMQTSLTSSSYDGFISPLRGGGYDDVAGINDNTLIYYPGSWHWSSYNTAGSGTGSIFNGGVGTSSMLLPRGAVYAFEEIPVYVGNVGWDTPQKTRLVELECLL